VSVSDNAAIYYMDSLCFVGGAAPRSPWELRSQVVFLGAKPTFIVTILSLADWVYMSHVYPRPGGLRPHRGGLCHYL